MLVVGVLWQGYDKVGYLKKKDSHNVGVWKRRWFTLKGKSLVYYKRVSGPIQHWEVLRSDFCQKPWTIMKNMPRERASQKLLNEFCLR